VILLLPVALAVPGTAGPQPAQPRPIRVAVEAAFVPALEFGGGGTHVVPAVRPAARRRRAIDTTAARARAHTSEAGRHDRTASALCATGIGEPDQARRALGLAADELTWQNATATLCFRWARRHLTRGAFQQSRRQPDDPNVSGESAPPLFVPSRPRFTL
jgi:hypothetical protein